MIREGPRHNKRSKVAKIYEPNFLTYMLENKLRILKDAHQVQMSF